jgi:hypothetical protein
MRFQVFWDVTLLSWVSSSWHKRHIGEDLDLEQYGCENLTSGMITSYYFTTFCENISKFDILLTVYHYVSQ